MKILHLINSAVLSISLLTIAGSPLFAADTAEISDAIKAEVTETAEKIAEKAAEKIADASEKAASKASKFVEGFKATLNNSKKAILNTKDSIVGSVKAYKAAGYNRFDALRKAITESGAWKNVVAPTGTFISNHQYVAYGTVVAGIVACIAWKAYKKAKKNNKRQLAVA